MVVIGVGYLGITHAACMAELGHEVLGVDVDEAKIEQLREGTVPLYEPGLSRMLRRHLAEGRLRFTTSYADAAEFGDVHFLCVGTPQRDGSDSADLSFVEAAVHALAAELTGPALVVGKCTVPVGTAARLARTVRRSAPGADLAWNPEFLREGRAVDDTLKPDRLVFGAESRAALDLLHAVYSLPIAAGTPVISTNFATAELVKAAANAFLATKVSFINAMAEICEATGADVVELARALGYDGRIGHRYLRPGLGFGGGCLPKDIRAFRARAQELGAHRTLEFLREVDAINLRRRHRLVRLAAEQCGGLGGRRVAVLGASFKPESDDVRDSPALYVAAAVQGEGAQVTVYDPKAIANARRHSPGLRYAGSARAAAAGADLVLHLTEWKEFQEIDPAELSPVVGMRAIVDGRNALDPLRWRAAGWTYRALGRP
ncbi:UDP-glucose dehydrogenase family protein [Mangrovihabitans endophyticus]|uniref:UDP-glucose dehydrogenase family protein n=1 Tax=Mangrovihabitans endophyticus TaxID=1751298 RepID=UPI001E448AA0|nr:UDP-glucose/GDP-mannose dehydrogenase family protein [Mangrovihabitans endophyticus]